MLLAPLTKPRAAPAPQAPAADEIAAAVVLRLAPPPLDDHRSPYHQVVYAANGSWPADAVYTVQDDPVYPLSVMARLTCSGIVADRSVALEYRAQDGLRYCVAGTQAVVQAGGQQSFCWHPEVGAVTWPIEDAALAALPQQLVLPGATVAVRIWNGQAGDVLDQVRISARFEPEAL